MQQGDGAVGLIFETEARLHTNTAGEACMQLSARISLEYSKDTALNINIPAGVQAVVQGSNTHRPTP
jgi:hypothetical protein